MHEFPRNRPAVRRKWVKFEHFKRADFDAVPQSRPLILCSEHFSECDFVNFMAEYQMMFAQSGICRAVHRVADLEKNPVRISKDEADEQQAHSMIPNWNWEIHWYPETSANKANTKSLTRMPTAENAVKERDCTQMPMAKKDRTDHKCLWQRKKDQTTNAGGKRKRAALIRQANSWHQMKETKQLKPPQNPKRLPTCKHKVE